MWLKLTGHTEPAILNVSASVVVIKEKRNRNKNKNNDSTEKDNILKFFYFLCFLLAICTCFVSGSKLANLHIDRLRRQYLIEYCYFNVHMVNVSFTICMNMCVCVLTESSMQPLAMQKKEKVT